jgi:hypothetical protein
MSPEAQQVLTHVNRLTRDLSDREKLVRQRLDHYGGKHKLRFASPEFSDYFGDRFKDFSDNWTAPVVNAPTERMNPLGIRLDVDDDQPGIAGVDSDEDGDAVRGIDKDMERVWAANDCDRGFSSTAVIALAASRGYATVWGDRLDENTPKVTFERPDQAIIRYGENRQGRDGLRLWRDDEHEYAVYDDGGEYLWKFRRNAVNRDGYTRSGLVMPGTIGGWEARQPDSDDVWPLPNPMGALSMVELSNMDLLDPENPLSDIDGVISMQDAINLIWAYLMNGLDYASLPQRIVTGAEYPKVPVLDQNGQKVGERVVPLDELIKDRVLWIPSKDAQTSEWTAARLDVFSAVIERAIEHIAAQTRTPPHYLIGKVANLSADAMTAAETGLVSKTEERITYINPGVKGIYRLIALAQGDERKATACRSARVVWKDTQYRSLAQKVDALAKARTMGFPFAWIAEQYGLEPAEVRRVLRMREAEQRDTQLDDMIKKVELIGKQATAAGVLVRGGWKEDASTEVVGLPDLEHTGLLPVTVQSEEKAAGLPGAAVNGTPVPAGD